MANPYSNAEHSKRFRHRRRSKVNTFAASEASRLASTAAGRTFTVNATTDVATATAHGLVTGTGPVVLTTSGTLPAGLALLTRYWPIVLTAYTFKLATSRANAAAGTAIDIPD